MTDATSTTETASAAADGSDHNREAAEWVLSKGGKSTVCVGDFEPKVVDSSESPNNQETFAKVEGIDLSHVNMCKYGRELDEPPDSLPSGWAAVLYLYGLR